MASVKQELAEELGDAVFVFSRERKVSPLMTMLAAVGTVLGRFAAQDDVTIGSALIRPQGDTSTTTRRPLPLRIDLSGEPDLGELAQRVRDVATGAFDHAGADLAFFERDPLFQILVEFEDGDDELPAEHRPAAAADPPRRRHHLYGGLPLRAVRPEHHRPPARLPGSSVAPGNDPAHGCACPS